MPLIQIYGINNHFSPEGVYIKEFAHAASFCELEIKKSKVSEYQSAPLLRESIETITIL